MTRKAPDFWWFEMLNELASNTYSGPTGNMNSPYDHKDLDKFFLLPVLSVGNQRFRIPFVEQEGAVVMRYPNGDVLLVKEITIEGGKKKSAAKALAEWSRAHEVAIMSHLTIGINKKTITQERRQGP